MDPRFFDEEVERALDVLRRGGVILYPTDTIWGLGCDATNAEAVRRIYTIKQRDDAKSLIILLADERSLLQYIAAPDPEVFPFLEEQERPTTVIYEGAIGLPDALVHADGTLAIRIVRDEFCRHLIKRLRKPIVSTSANISGQPTPQDFASISQEIRGSVDHVVRWRQQEEAPARPSRIIRWTGGGQYQVIRD